MSPWSFPRTERPRGRRKPVSVAKVRPPRQTPLWAQVNRAYMTGERDIRRQVLEALGDMFDGATLGKLEAAFLTGRIDTVLRVVNVPEVMERLAARLSPAALTSLNTGVNHLSREILASGGVPAGVLAETFGDLWTKEAERFAGLWSSRLVREVGGNTEKAIRQITQRAYRQSLGTRAAAKEIRSIIGLTANQAEAVTNFRAGLIQAIEEGRGIKSIEGRWGLSRDILRSDRQLTLGNVDRLTQAYRTRYITHRAGTIASTESVRIYNSGRLLAMRRLEKETGQKGTKRWLTTPDERACEICLPMNDQEVPVDGVFEMGLGGTIGSPPAHTKCRCSMVWISARKAAKPRSTAENRAARRLKEISDQRAAAAAAARAARTAAQLAPRGAPAGGAGFKPGATAARIADDSPVTFNAAGDLEGLSQARVARYLSENGVTATPEEFLRRVAHFPDDAVLHVDQFSAVTTFGSDKQLEIALRAVSPSGKPMGSMHRIVDLRAGYAKNIALELSEAYRGHGIGKQILSSQVEFYKTLGIKKLELSTSDIGRYAWARYGFVPDSRSWTQLVGSMKRALKAPLRGSFSEDAISDMAALLEKVAGDPEGIRLVASSPLGKELLLNGASWTGSLDLASAEAMEYFNAYIGG